MSWTTTIVTLMMSLTLMSARAEDPDQIDFGTNMGVQIEQHNSGTSHFNAVGALVEMGYRAATGDTRAISRAPFLVELSVPEGRQEEAEIYLVDSVNNLKGLIFDSDLPVSTYFSSGMDYPAMSKKVQADLLPLQSKRVALPFTLSSEKLFSYGRLQTGKLTQADLDAVIAWVRDKHSPVLVGAKFEEVIDGKSYPQGLSYVVAGYSFKTNHFLVVSSKKVDVKTTGEWKPADWFIQNVYSAVGAQLRRRDNNQDIDFTVSGKTAALAAAKEATAAKPKVVKGKETVQEVVVPRKFVSGFDAWMATVASEIHSPVKKKK
jgi:hypothetical protein